MDVVKEDVIKLVDKELKAANEKFTLFASDHEGYAVIKEEVEEAENDLQFLNFSLKEVWKEVKQNNQENKEEWINLVKKRAINLACEAIQVAAMAQKFIDSVESRTKKESGYSDE